MAAQLVDTVAQARTTFAELSVLTEPKGLGALRAEGVSAQTLNVLYPFDLAEHIPSIIEIVLHGPHTAEIAPLLRDSDVLEAHYTFARREGVGVVSYDGTKMNAAARAVEAYLRVTYGPWTTESSPYENVAYMWAYLLEFFHEVSTQVRPPVAARTGLAKAMKRQRATAQRLIELVQG